MRVQLSCHVLKFLVIRSLEFQWNQNDFPSNLWWKTFMKWPLFHFGHGDVITWKQFPRYWPIVRGIQQWPVNSPHNGQWRGALMFSLICAWINDWVNNREDGDLSRHRAHYDVTVMKCDAHPSAIPEVPVISPRLYLAHCQQAISHWFQVTLYLKHCVLYNCVFIIFVHAFPGRQLAYQAPCTSFTDV